MKERRKEENKKTKKNFLFSRKKANEIKNIQTKTQIQTKSNQATTQTKQEKKGLTNSIEKIQKTESKIQKPLIIEKKLDVKNQPNIKKSLENLQKKNNTTRK